MKSSVKRSHSIASPTRWLSLAAALCLSTGAQAGILGSKHDLSNGGSAQQTTSNTTEVCVFCHTPHGSDVAASVPLWNKVLTPGASYQRYSALQTSSLDGSEAPVGSISLACLSCHDGTQAMDVVINAPGSGGWSGSGTQIDTVLIGVMVGNPAGAPIPVLGLDLRDDHPISIQYAGGGCSTTDIACSTLGDADFNTPANAIINGVRIWWVDTSIGSTGVREKTDMQLYTRTDITGGSGSQEPTVECGSCHDPHADTSTPVSFLRINNANSDVCRACHNK